MDVYKPIWVVDLSANPEIEEDLDTDEETKLEPPFNVIIINDVAPSHI